VVVAVAALSLLASVPAVADDSGTDPPQDTPTARSFTVGATGDIIPNDNVRRTAAVQGRREKPRKRYDFAPQFAPMKDSISAVDLAICHVEMPIGTKKQSPGLIKVKGFGTRRLYAPYELAQGLVDTGFDRCSTASNHSYEVGDQGINSTLDALDAVGITHHGTARTPEEAATIELLDVNGVKVAHLSYYRTPRSRDQKNEWRVNDGHQVARIAADVAAARAEGAEVVILSIHIGSAGSIKPERTVVEYLDRLTLATHVDLIIMHGPHVVQPVKQYRNTWVLQSVGNFVSGMGPGFASRLLRSMRTLDGLLAEATFTEDLEHPGTFTVSVAPVAICTTRSNRSVYPATATLARTDISKSLRKELTACLTRVREVVPEAQ